MQLLTSELVRQVSERSGGRLGMTLVGGDPIVSRFMPPQSAGEGAICFLTDPAYAEAMKGSKASLLVMREQDAEAIWKEDKPERALLLCDNPYAFFAFASQIFFPLSSGETGIDPRADVSPEANVHPDALIEAFAVVKAGATIGARTVVKSGAYVDVGAQVGEDVILQPNCYVGPTSIVGDRTILQPGSVIGADGFGFAPFKGEWVKIPQVGRVVLGTDVEVGSNTTIDRGALDDTTVGDGTKLDNQIQLGHNDKIGKHVVMAACVGIAGSTSVGDHCMIGGAAMINGHITIPSGSGVGPATAITGWGKEAATKTGFFPAQDGKNFALTAASLARLPEMRKSLRDLQRAVQALEAQLATKTSEG